MAIKRHNSVQIIFLVAYILKGRINTSKKNGNANKKDNTANSIFLLGACSR